MKGLNDMQIVKYLDTMQSLIESAGKVPMTNKVMIDKEEMLNLIESIYNYLPEEFKKAQWIVHEKEKILQDATEQAEKIKQESYEYHKKRLKNHDLVKEARLQAETMLMKADRTSKEMQTEATNYAGEILHSVESEIAKFRMEIIESIKEDVNKSLHSIDGKMDEVIEKLKDNQSELRKM